MIVLPVSASPGRPRARPFRDPCEGISLPNKAADFSPGSEQFLRLGADFLDPIPSLFQALKSAPVPCIAKRVTLMI